MNEVIENNLAITSIRNFYMNYRKVILAVAALVVLIISTYLINNKISKMNNLKAAEIYNKWIAQETDTDEGILISEELFAQKELAIALKGDITLSREAKDKLQEITKSDGSTENQVVSSFAETISQKLENIQIQGASKRFSDIVTHPITNQKMYVAVYSLSVSSTQNARAMEASQYRASVNMISENQSSKGVKESYNKTIENAKKDTKSFKK